MFVVHSNNPLLPTLCCFDDHFIMCMFRIKVAIKQRRALGQGGLLNMHDCFISKTVRASRICLAKINFLPLEF